MRNKPKFKSRAGKNNANWKNGIGSFSTASEFLCLNAAAQKIVIERILARYNKRRNGRFVCWEWTGGVFQISGRPSYSAGNNRILVARIVAAFFIADPCDQIVRHKCDNVLCINPSHLLIGTNAENSADMVRRKRSLYGEKNHQAKLSRRDVQTIRRRFKRGDSNYQIAKDYGVSTPCIAYIRNGKSWSK